MPNSPPPSKRPRRFFIEELLREPFNQLSPPRKSPKDYVKLLNSETELVPKFQWLKNKSNFIIENVPADPEALLIGIFQECMDEAMNESRVKGIKPTHLGCTISSQLLTSDIWIPIRQLTPDTINTILNRFNDVAQSKKQDGVTLWGEPFTVSVTTVNRNGLPEKRQLKGGAARKLAPVNHKIHQQCLIKIENADNYCLFYAMQATMVRTVGAMTRQHFYDYLHGIKTMIGKLQRETTEMMNAVNAPLNLLNYDAEIYVPRIIDWWNDEKFARQWKFKAFIFGSAGHYKPLFKYGADDYDVSILLYFDEGHFNGVQKNGNLFGRPYCLSCEKTYDRPKQHTKSCKARCIKCSQMGPLFPCKPIDGFRQKCSDCNKMFFNQVCYQHHLSLNFCKTSKECKHCGVVWDLNNNTKNGREGHKCNERWCENCQIFHEFERGCFIRPLEPNHKKETMGWRLVTFDLETTQHTPIDPDFPEKRKHQVNFVTAKVACPDCISSGRWKESLRGKFCNVCGYHRTVTFSQMPFHETTVDKQNIDRHPLVAFVKWILYKLPKQYDTIAYSHFGGRFDMVLVFRELLLEGFNPSMIKKGNRLFEMKVKSRKKMNPNVTFRDSWNLIPGPLASMVPMFGLDVQDKPFFPHLANRPENYGCNLFPTKADYLADGMNIAKRKEFDKWYQENRNAPFLLDESLASYCKNDVDILMAGLIAFRSEFLEMTKRSAGADGKADRAAYTTPHNGIDPIRHCITIASACMRHFRTNHLKPAHLALVPEKGYDSCGDNQSDLALNFMEWYAEKFDVQIQNAYSANGEKRVGNFRLDGWIESQQKGLEIHGCIWHACSNCYPDDNEVLPCGKTAGRIREKNKRRMEIILEQVPNVEIFWQCEIETMLAKDKQMRKKFDEYTGDGGPIDIRASFMGGRTGALKLFHEAAEGQKISYYDVTSLYPFINFTTDYPIGHPTLHVPCEEVDWRRPEDNPYPLAILKVFVIPPRKIDVPVLPVKVDDRLCFPLCMKCCKKFPNGAVKLSYSCKHSDRERGWISTCTSLELNAALEEGYRVTDLLRVLEYTKSDNKLFRPYMSEFVAEKMHASGFDETIRGNVEAEEQFIAECNEQFGIQIDRTKMVPNKGKRALAKLAVNNLWGRFSLRNFGLSQTHITDDPSELANYLDNKKIEVTGLDMLTPDRILISYQQKKDWIKEHPCSNVVISLFTTSAARVHLLKAMQKVVRTPGCVLLYTDTDSLIYAHPIGLNPLKTGPHLGQFTDEFPEHEILEFVSGGSKQYGLKLRRNDSDQIEHVLKLRGITLNYDVTENQGLRYDTFKDSVIKFAREGKVTPIKAVYPNFLRPTVKEGIVTSAPMQKTYKPYVGKGIVCSHDFRVLDFGYISP